MGTLVIVSARIPGGRDKKNSGVTSSTDRVLKSFRARGRSPACADHADIDTLFLTVDGVIDRLDRILRRPETAASKKLERHYLYFPVHARNAFVIVAFGTDYARAMRSVPIVVHRIADICIGIKSMLVVKSSKF